jgi:hypothetical protein
MNYYPYSSPYGTPQNRAQYGVPSYGGYNYAPQQQQMPPAPQNQPQAQPQYEMPIQDIRFVTAEEAKAFIVMPNSRVLLIDRSGTAYLKTADNMGQSVTQYFKFEPVNADGTPIRPQEEPTIDLSAFVKREDLQSLPFVTMEQYSALANELRQLKEQIVRGRPNGTKPNNPQ